MPHVNAWGEPIEEIEAPQDIYWVTPKQRKDTDDDLDANDLQTDPFDPDSVDDDTGGPD